MTKDIYYKNRVYKDCEPFQTMTPGYKPSVKQFENYLEQFNSYPYTCPYKKDGQTVVEGVDYTINHEVLSHDDRWCKCTEQQYGHYREGWKRMVAVSINTDGNKLRFDSTILDNRVYSPNNINEFSEQDKFWNEIVNELIPGYTPHENTIDNLKKHFTILRKTISNE